MSKDLYEFERINIFTLGNSIIGKSTFIIRYTQNIFEERYIANYGIDYKIKKIILPNGKKIKLCLYDTAGQERFKSISLNMIKMADGILLMYDITDRSSFESIKDWAKSIIDEKGENFPIVLLGNKIDLEDKRQVSTKEGQNEADALKLKFFETSNKEGINIEESILELVSLVNKKKEEDKEKEINKMKLEKNKAKNNGKKCKC